MDIVGACQPARTLVFGHTTLALKKTDHMVEYLQEIFDRISSSFINYTIILGLRVIQHMISEATNIVSSFNKHENDTTREERPSLQQQAHQSRKYKICLHC